MSKEVNEISNGVKNILNFLIEADKLKGITRTGWIIWRIKSPETIAEHIVRVAFLAYLLGEKKGGLKVKNCVQNAISHDLCEVYAGDATPLFYYENLDVRRKKDREILMKGIRLSQKDKEKRLKIKFLKEKRSLAKLLSFLPEEISRDIMLRWLDYEKGFSKEGKFVKQLDWLENLIQSLEYLGPKGSGAGWWELAEEKVDDPLLIEFLGAIQEKFYGKKKGYKKNKDLEAILEFILFVGKLKSMPRLYWKLRKVKNPETVAGHLFTLAVMAWVLGFGQRVFNMEKLIKMALCHELSAIYAGDTTPYDRILAKDGVDRQELLKRMLRLSKKEKESFFIKDYQKEKNSLKKLTHKLSPHLKKEMLQLWQEYRTKSSPEGKFLSQLNVAAVLFQGLIYEKKYKSFSASPIWEWAFEVTDDPLILEFLEALKQKFYSDRS